jgi:hypothetical protein
MADSVTLACFSIFQVAPQRRVYPCKLHPLIVTASVFISIILNVEEF